MCNSLLIRIYLILLLLVSGLSASSCAQMTRHSNTLVFATDTTLGVAVGQSSSQTPKIDIGYVRREFAFVPLLANTEVAGKYLNPCPDSGVEKCLFQATLGGDDKDSYSTIASFGSKVGVDGSTDARVSIAQYFATGVAAQQLVLSGGANIVAAGGDTKAKAEAATEAAKVEKSKLELQLEKEKNNQVLYGQNINAGKVAAKTILGDKNNPVTQVKRQELATRIGGTGCDDSILAGLDQSTVEKFIADMESKRFQCLARLGTEVQK